MADETLTQLYQHHTGKVSDKWQLYLTEYDRLLSGFRKSGVRLLEIGVQNGGSLEIWARYFHNAKVIAGCDIDPGCAQLAFEDKRITVFVGDANSDDTQARILQHSAEFDVLIDDGSHTSSDIIKSFARYFPYIAAGGVYIIEDLHCSYWQEFEGGLFDPLSSMTFFKRLADIVNVEHWGINKSGPDLLKSFISNYEIELDESILQQIRSVEFCNSICVVRKTVADSSQLGNRVIAGQTEQVAKGHLELPKDYKIDVKSQEANYWSARDLPPAEELPIRIEEADNLATQIVELKKLVADREAQVLDLGRKVESRETQVRDLSIKVEDREAQVRDLGHKVQERETQVRDLSHKVQERETQVRDLSHKVQDRETQVRDLSHKVQDREAQVRDLNQCVDLRDAQLKCLYQSRSWRLGSPLRKLWKLLYFNEKYYLDENPDVKSNGMDPFEHYFIFGQIEGRKPGPPSFLSFCWNGLGALRNAVRAEGGVFKSAVLLKTVLKDDGPSEVKARIQEIFSSRQHNVYREWISKYDTLSEQNRVGIRKQISRMASKPLISILMPTFNTRVEWLEEAIESVKGQLYENWELCIADDASTNPETRAFLEAVAGVDQRIKVTFRRENGHISKASNSALELCNGEWVVLFDHDDLLAEHALFCVADAIDHNPSVQLIYSDEDKIREDGERSDPYFKCDWNLDLFYSQNMISHLGAYRKKILQEIGGFRAGFEGSQDYDLVLRYIEHIDQKDIHHIPRVLYHWRVHSESTARRTDAKPYASIAAERALQEHLDRKGIAAKVERLPFGQRVHYSLPEKHPLVSLIIPTRNALHLLRVCIESIIEKSTYQNYEIIVIDNGSDDPEIIDYFSKISEMHNLRVIRDDQPFNYSRINNLAVTQARGELVGFINNDIEVISPDWLGELVSFALQPGVGAVGAKLLYPDKTVQHAGVVLGIGGIGNHAFNCQPGNSPGYFGRAQLINSYSAVTAACLVIKKEIFLEVGGFDAENLAVAFSDVDLCLKVIEAGFRNVWTPYSLLYHHESATRGADDTREKQARFAAENAYMHNRWDHILMHDPAYSPNLTLQAEDFSLAWPPRLKSMVG